MPGSGTPIWPARTCSCTTNVAEGAVSVMPRPQFMTMRSPQVRSATANSLSQIACGSAAAA